ncbi:MAG: arylsulfatase A-like enzyme [Kiritimatiellia bacterium]|jgi:arylsulfatase A-like enzyme
MMKIISTLCMLIIAAISIVSAAAADKPNILYINIDDLGIMDVGYNNSKFNTPHIDQLVKDGMLFSNAYAPAANCEPSRACVHSGQWGARHGVYTVGSSERGKATTRRLIPTPNSHGLEGLTTMAMALKAAGYKTIHLGKYHMGKDPLRLGYDVNVGGDQSGGPSGGGYFSPWTRGAMSKWSDQYHKGTHRMDVFADQAVKFMQTHRDEAMFIHFSPYSVHTGLEKVPQFYEKYKGTGVDAVYASMVENVDKGVGKVLTALSELGLAENTLVVFSSDNGGIRSISPQDPYRAGKGSYYDGGIREPLVMRWPGKITPASSNDTPVCTLDLYPTFLAAAHLERPQDTVLDGVDLMPLMTGSGSIEERALYWHFPIYLQAYNPKEDDGRDPLFRTRPGSAMRFGKWKLHEYFEDGAFELYDLESDPGERNDLAASMPDKLNALKKMLFKWRADIDAPVPRKLNPQFVP